PRTEHSWGFADCRPERQGMVWGSYRAAEELLELDPVLLAHQATDTRPVYAVCAHGTRDMCCAIEGRPVATALARHCPGRAWEGSCTVAVQRVTGAPAMLTCRDAKAKVPLSYHPLWLRAD